MNIQIFGESHGPYIGAVVDGFPAGVKIEEKFLESEMKRRSPNASFYSTQRIEADAIEFVSGISNGYTTGSPLCFIIKNADFKKSDYQHEIPRPSHADYPAHIRFKGFADQSGGGHFSGRLTAPMVAIGALCKLALLKYNINFYSKINSVGKLYDTSFSGYEDTAALSKLNKADIPVLDDGLKKNIVELLEKVKQDGNSVGAKIETMAINVPVGIGGYNRIEKELSSKFFEIPAVKAVEFGLGVKFAESFGKDVNDEYYIDSNKVKTKTNNNGGVLGGLSTGMPIIAKVTFKPTPSIYSKQNSVNLKTMKNTDITISGRHDPCVAIRAIVVVESMMAVQVLELLLEAYGYAGF